MVESLEELKDFLRVGGIDALEGFLDLSLESLQISVVGIHHKAFNFFLLSFCISPLHIQLHSILWHHGFLPSTACSD